MHILQWEHIRHPEQRCEGVQSKCWQVYQFSSPNYNYKPFLDMMTFSTEVKKNTPSVLPTDVIWLWKVPHLVLVQSFVVSFVHLNEHC